MEEPRKSAQSYIIWDEPSGIGVTRGDRVYYKYIKQGFFSRKILFVWRPDFNPPRWEVSAWRKPPRSCAKSGQVVSITEQERAEMQRRACMDPDDLAWEQEQQEFKRKAAARRQERLEKDKARDAALKNNKTGELLDAFIKRNRR
jgi:hypothetical protein